MKLDTPIMIAALPLLTLVIAGCNKTTPEDPAPPTAAAPAAVAPPKPEAKPPAEASTGPVIVHLHRGDKTLEELFADEVGTAAAAGNTVVVMFTADWCTPCQTIKDLVSDSPTVQALTKKLRFVLIDVDEWRGPAHQLIAGANPNKLPLLVAVDSGGQPLAQTYGTALGLLSEKSVGDNLARLAAGKKPVTPDYSNNKDERMKLIRADIARHNKKREGVPVFEHKVTKTETIKTPNGPALEITLDVTVRNHESMRRWWVLPTALKDTSKPIAFTDHSKARFVDHVRATYDVFETTPPTHLLPVAGWGTATLKGYIVTVPVGTKELFVYKLNRPKIGTQKLSFEKKVSYALTIPDAASTVAQSGPGGSGKLDLTVKDTHVIALK